MQTLLLKRKYLLIGLMVFILSLSEHENNTKNAEIIVNDKSVVLFSFERNTLSFISDFLV